MCGIAGILKFNKNLVSRDELKRMTDVIAHRGPDGEGQWINLKQNIGLGHRRLSIIDLSEGAKQPMHYADGRYTITYNGEIYNYIELKQQLERKGYAFSSNSDTEVLLALYDHKKEKCLEELDGMFAFAIWDEREQILFCARDRFGEKPFHYYLDADKFIFCSEIKQLWTYGITKKVSDKRMKAFLLHGEVDDKNDMSASFYEGVKRLDAANYMVIKAIGQPEIKKYWEIDLNSVPFLGSIEKSAEQFLSLLTESIRLRLRSDVPVGSSLSGGIDSSAIVMLIDQLKGSEQNQSTFSARFKNYDKDEGKYIEEVVKSCKNVNVSYTWPDENYFLKVFDKVTYHQDEPYGSASIIAQYAVMELAASKGITVLLDGQGADEYLAGYLPSYNLYLYQLFYNKRKLYRSEMNHYNSFHAHVSEHISLEEKETLRMKVGRLKRKTLNQAMPFDTNALKNDLRSDTTRFGLKTLLRYADRNSMAHSREVRLPFLSHKLVEFAFSLPDDHKLQQGWTKFVLRKATEAFLPKSICWRTDKIGYEPPQATWLSSDQIKEEIRSASKNYQDLGLSSLKDQTNVQWRLLLAKKYS